jgi:hypothetical protein
MGNHPHSVVTDRNWKGGQDPRETAESKSPATANGR